MSDVLPALPPGYRSLDERGAHLAVREDFVERFGAWGLRAATGEPFDATDLHGRHALLAVRGSEGTVLVRRYRHGGILAPLTGARYARPDRPFEELALAARLTEVGVPTPEVVAARARPLAPFGWRLELFTLRVAGAVDLGRRIEERRAGTLADATWRRLVASFGALVGRAHAAGFLHADLHPKNVLVDRGDALWFVDLDRARLLSGAPPEAREANLERLWRWVAREHASAPFLGPSDALRFLVAWGRAGGGDDVRATLARVADRHARRASLHRVGRRLQGRG